jgi:hypothetical protein
VEETKQSNTSPELTLEQVLNSIVGYLAQGNSGHYNIGRLYNYTVDNELAQKHGHASAQEFFSQRIQELSQATLSRYGAVARHFTEDACRKHGVVKLSTLRTYAEATSTQVAAGDPGSMLIDVPQKDGAVLPKPFAECSAEELRQAVKHKRKPGGATLPGVDAARVEFMRNSLSRHFAQGSRVQLKTSILGGKTILTIQGVPLEQMEQLLEALMDGLQPVQPLRATG